MFQFGQKNCIACIVFFVVPIQAFALVELANQPVLSTSSIPGNLALALSVEYPTAESTAHRGDYDNKKNYLGYFDPDKCYSYHKDTSAYVTDTGFTVASDKGDNSYFYPSAKAQNHVCSSAWSGNFLNWATMSTIDPFRWAMTGGNRVVDTESTTIIQKAWHNGSSAFDARKISDSTLALGATPFSEVNVVVGGKGFAMSVTGGGKTENYTVRVKVCDSNIGLESNCRAYGKNSKPEGLIQKYSQQIRFSAFGYLNDDNAYRDGSILRARQKFVGPLEPRVGQPSVINAVAEWSATTGILVRNPDVDDAINGGVPGVAVNDSGVVNYLNKFGQLYPGKYKSLDPVNELFYAALRYFRNQENIESWSWTTTKATESNGAPPVNKSNGTSVEDRKKWVDGFPVIKNWKKTDPILYSCQKNFILGIGDTNTHVDRNVPGDVRSEVSGALKEPPAPSFGNDASFFDAYGSTLWVRGMQGLSGSAATMTGSSFSPDYMAGLAYQANVKDIRPDISGSQTVQTYWVDVLETGFKQNNKFYMAAKYGGMKVPSNFNQDLYSSSKPIPEQWWFTSGENVNGGKYDPTKSIAPRPDNYFTGNSPDKLISGLTRAFESIVGDIKAYTTTFSLSSKQVAGSNEASYAAQYDSENWSGEVTGTSLEISSSGSPSLAPVATWTTRTVFESQLDGTGWNTGRSIVTMASPSSTTTGGIPFRHNKLTTEQKQLLNTSYVAGDDSANFLNFLRGDPANEGAGYRMRSKSTATGLMRSRLGDIVNSKITVVAAPAARYADNFNPGYSSFKKTQSSRAPMLYVGANDGMLHAFKAGLGSEAGRELFAYVPSALFYKAEPTDTDGLLAKLGSPTYAHRNYVDATALAFDIDFARAGGALQSDPTQYDWRTVLIGGLGKGGRSYYAIDVTNPAAMTNEAAVAQKVLWEFPTREKLPTASGGSCNSDCIDMGYTFGDPVMVKTAKHGWVVVFSSGYNNADGIGHIFIVNPTNGALLQDISTGSIEVSGMARPAAYVLDYSDFTSDSIYVGDLEGRLWRFPLNSLDGAGNYTSPTVIAQFSSAPPSAGSSGSAQPITTQPLIEVDPWTRRRYVMVGTGRLLDGTDILNSQEQSFYAVIDGYSDAFSAKAADKDDWPALRTDFAAVVSADETAPRKANIAGKAGWVIDLGITDNVGWRVVGLSTAYNGTVGFSSVLPTGDACNPSGRSNIYAVSFANGSSAIKTSNNENADFLDYISHQSLVNDFSFFNVQGKIQPWIGDNKGVLEKITGKFTSQRSRSLSWRELSTFR